MYFGIVLGLWVINFNKNLLMRKRVIVKGIELPGYKSINSPQNGDCLRAALANIVGMPARKIPHYNDYFNWREVITNDSIDIPKYLNSIYEPCGFRVEYTKQARGLQVAVVQNKKNKKRKQSHALVSFNGDLIWCPSIGYPTYYKKTHVLYFLNVKIISQ